jgi:endonuclease YncB( thermonuclease family)
VYVGGVDVNYEQVKRGLAWHYKSYAAKQQSREVYDAYSSAEQAAQSARAGLWADSSPMEPWKYRHGQ